MCDMCRTPEDSDEAGCCGMCSVPAPKTEEEARWEDEGGSRKLSDDGMYMSKRTFLAVVFGFVFIFVWAYMLVR